MIDEVVAASTVAVAGVVSVLPRRVVRPVGLDEKEDGVVCEPVDAGVCQALSCPQPLKHVGATKSRNRRRQGHRAFLDRFNG